MKKSIYIIHYKKYRINEPCSHDYDMLEYGAFETKELAFSEIMSWELGWENKIVCRTDNSILIKPDCSKCDDSVHCLGFSCYLDIEEYTIKELTLNCSDS